MENQSPNFLAEIPDADWEKTPESVKRLVVQLLERIADERGAATASRGTVAAGTRRIRRNRRHKMRRKG